MSTPGLKTTVTATTTPTSSAKATSKLPMTSDKSAQKALQECIVCKLVRTSDMNFMMLNLFQELI